MADISYWSDEYDKHLFELEKLIDVAKKALGDSRQTAVETCEAEVKRIKDIKKSFGLELKMIKDKSLKVQFDVKSRENETRLNDLTKEIQQVKANNEKQELTQGAARKIITTEGKTNEDLLLEAATIQDKTVESLDRTRAMIEQSKEVGAATLEVLKQQRDQIKDIDQEVSQIDTNLKKAEKLITSFAKRVATDRAIQVLTLLNIGVLVAIIIYIIYTKKGLTNTAKSLGFTDTSRTPSVAPTPSPPTILSIFGESLFLRREDSTVS